MSVFGTRRTDSRNLLSLTNTLNSNFFHFFYAVCGVLAAGLQKALVNCGISLKGAPLKTVHLVNAGSITVLPKAGNVPLVNGAFRLMRDLKGRASGMQSIPRPVNGGFRLRGRSITGSAAGSRPAGSGSTPADPTIVGGN